MAEPLVLPPDANGAIATVQDHLRHLQSMLRIPGARLRVDLTEAPHFGSSTFSAEVASALADLVGPWPQKPATSASPVVGDAREVDEIDITGWGVWKGHAIPMSVARYLAEKVNERIRAALSTPTGETAAVAGEPVGVPDLGIYTASKTKHAAIWKAYRERGYPVISTWIDEAGVGESSDLTDLWRRCLSEAASARVLVIYREPDDVLKGGWAEVGAALTSGVPVYAVGIEDFTIGKAAGVTHFPTLGHAMEAARTLAVAPPAPASQSGAEIEQPVSPSDPRTIIEGIRAFGLAPDGSDLRDLRDLEAALATEREKRERMEARVASAEHVIGKLQTLVINTLGWVSRGKSETATEAISEAWRDGWSAVGWRQYLSTHCAAITPAPAGETQEVGDA